MKFFAQILLLGFASGLLHAQNAEEVVKSNLEKHIDGSEKLADEQDELSADVQQLVMEQTVEQVIELLSEVEGIMDETTDYLVDYETGGKTIAAQTEIIEKIHAAAKAKQSSGQGGEAGGAMMEMMERMMGKKGEGEGEKEGEEKGGDQAGKGQTGDSDAQNESEDGKAGKIVEERTVPKAAGKAGRGLPKEFQSALDAYNRGLEETTK
ncbi:hypothetical protein [Luteolibacter sp. AS25]|uniref:hypothetical protein n=1 Tax=Luteolibacter sp. AS25 TaxID=3135776 RepID=UPI00398B83DF